MIMEKLIELTEYYIREERCKEELIEYCNQYDVIYSNFKENLELECSKLVFELFDDIFMICDSFEANENIRFYEKHCIDENELVKKIKKKFLKINQLCRV